MKLWEKREEAECIKRNLLMKKVAVSQWYERTPDSSGRTHRYVFHARPLAQIIIFTMDSPSIQASNMIRLFHLISCHLTEFIQQDLCWWQ